jgi:hypothetical protein
MCAWYLKKGRERQEKGMKGRAREGRKGKVIKESKKGGEERTENK